MKACAACLFYVTFYSAIRFRLAVLDYFAADTERFSKARLHIYPIDAVVGGMPGQSSYHQPCDSPMPGLRRVDVIPRRVDIPARSRLKQGIGSDGYIRRRGENYPVDLVKVNRIIRQVGLCKPRHRQKRVVQRLRDD